MKSILTALIFLLALWVFGGTWYWVCQVKSRCAPSAMDENTVSPAANVATPDDLPTREEDSGRARSVLTPTLSRPFVVSYHGVPVIQQSANFRFGRGNATAFIPATVQLGLDSLVRYLSKHPDQDLEITGQFAEEEPQPDPDDYLNLGLARADHISAHLKRKGVDEDRMIKSYARPDAAALFGGADSISGGVDLKLVDRASASRLANPQSDSTGESKEEKREEVRFEPRSLYFETASDYLPMDDDLRAYITGVIQYLNQNKDKKLVLTGNTDDVGSRAFNRRLGQNRANTIRRYFIEFGLNAGQITTTSQGEDAPVVSNNSEEGRRRNRRVEITIQ